MHPVDRRGSGSALPQNVSSLLLSGDKAESTVLRLCCESVVIFASYYSRERFYGSILNTRHAYIPLHLAVKTGRPHKSMNFLLLQPAKIINFLAGVKIIYKVYAKGYLVKFWQGKIAMMTGLLKPIISIIVMMSFCAGLSCKYCSFLPVFSE